MATATATQATTSQMWYLHILAKRDTKSLTLSKDDASILIDYYRGQFPGFFDGLRGHQILPSPWCPLTN